MNEPTIGDPVSGKPPTMTRRQRAWHILGNLSYIYLAIHFTVGWARVLMGDDMSLPWPLYPIAAVLFLWTAIQRMIDDAKGDA